jgi:uncharacterized protein YdiU (UPF0061 family)
VAGRNGAGPALLALNEQLATEFGVIVDGLRAPDGVAVLVGDTASLDSSPVAQAYVGHQFGGYSPRLGDGRALLLGEVLDGHGQRRDLHLKGSGRTPFARGGDGKAAVGPMLREYVIGEAMHALGIPTTRALGVVATGDHAIARHYPHAVETKNRYLAFFEGAATDVLRSFADRYHRYWSGGMRAKLGLVDVQHGDFELIDDLLTLLHAQHVDYTSLFRALSSSLLGERAPARSLFADVGAFDERPGLEAFAAPAPASFGRCVTFCGT